jgi:hypothetical protein
VNYGDAMSGRRERSELPFWIVFQDSLAERTSANSALGCATMVANMMPLMMIDQAVSQ